MTVPEQVMNNIAAAEVLDAIRNRAAQCIGRTFKVNEIRMSVRGVCLAAVETNLKSATLRSWLKDSGATGVLLVSDQQGNVAEIMFKAANHD